MRDRSSHWLARYVNDLKSVNGTGVLIFFSIIYCLLNFSLVFVGVLQLTLGSSPWHSFRMCLTSGFTWFLAINLFLGCVIITCARLKYAKDTFTLYHKYGYRLMGGGKFECVYNKDQRGKKPLSGKFHESAVVINKHVVTDGRWYDSEWCVNGESTYNGSVDLRNATKAEFFAAKRKGLLGDYKFTIIDKSQKETAENPAFTADDVDDFGIVNGKADATTFEKICNMVRLLGRTEARDYLNSLRHGSLVSRVFAFMVITLMACISVYGSFKVGMCFGKNAFISIVIILALIAFILVRRLSRLM